MNSIRMRVSIKIYLRWENDYLAGFIGFFWAKEGGIELSSCASDLKVVGGSSSSG